MRTKQKGGLLGRKLVEISKFVCHRGFDKQGMLWHRKVGIRIREHDGLGEMFKGGIFLIKGVMI